MEFRVFSLRISLFSASPVLRQRQSVANPAGGCSMGALLANTSSGDYTINKRTGIVPFRAVGSFFVQGGNDSPCGGVGSPGSNW